MMSEEIQNIVFSRFVNQPLPFEFISISDLYDRCAQSAYDLSELHRIKFNAIIIISAGEGLHIIDFKEQYIRPGNIIPLRKEQVHAFQKPRRVEGYVISFEEDLVIQNQNEQNLFHFLQLFHNPLLLLQEGGLDAIQSTLALIQQIHNETDLHLKSELISSILMTLVLQIKRHSSLQNEIIETQRFKDYLTFHQLIQQHYQETHNASDYAKMMSVSYKYLNDICKQIENHTTKSVIDHWLLLEVKRKISEKRYTAQEIAYEMGFKDPSNFTRFFKKHTGITPIQFLKLL